MAEPSRIKEIPANELTDEQQKVLQDLTAGRGKVLTPYKIWIHAPQFAAAFEKVGTYLNKKGALNTREVELAICIIANHWQGEYVWAAHVKICVALGMDRSVFDAIQAGSVPNFDNERERAIYDLSQIAMAPGGGSDAVFERAQKTLGRKGIAEVLGLLGYYSSVAMGMKLHRVPLPE
jgi:4-carboxymuconolactone decarboxylase